MCTGKLPGLVPTSEYVLKHDLVLLCVLETVTLVVYDQLLRRNVYQVSKHEIFALQIHMTTLPSQFVSTVVPLQTMSEKQNQWVFLYCLASCDPIPLQHHNTRHRKLGQLVTWDQSVQVLWKATVSFLTAEMTLALFYPISILCLDREELTVVLVLKVGVVKSTVVWWPNIDPEIEEMVKGCNECQLKRAAPPEAPCT